MASGSSSKGGGRRGGRRGSKTNKRTQAQRRQTESWNPSMDTPSEV